jgi:hypothetical protein
MGKAVSGIRRTTEEALAGIKMEAENRMEIKRVEKREQ